jgi:hypothetical protein
MNVDRDRHGRDLGFESPRGYHLLTLGDDISPKRAAIA